MRVSICSIVCDIPCSRINLIIISSLSGRIRYLPSKNSYPNCKKMAPYCNGHRMRGVGASFRLTTLLPCFPRPAALWVSRKVEVKYESPRPSKEERGWLHGTDVRGELAWWERKAAAWVRSTLGSQFWLCHFLAAGVGSVSAKCGFCGPAGFASPGRELVRNADCQAPPQTSWNRIQIAPLHPSGACAHCIWRDTGLGSLNFSFLNR